MTRQQEDAFNLFATLQENGVFVIMTTKGDSVIVESIRANEAIKYTKIEPNELTAYSAGEVNAFLNAKWIFSAPEQEKTEV